MVKVFVNNIPLYLMPQADEHLLSSLETSSAKELITERFSNQKSLLSLIDKLDHRPKIKTVKVYYSDAVELFNIFSSLYKSVHAAGGVVKNDRNETLMIFRRGKWDLPKGKIEKNETKEDAAIREVMEETGLKSLTLESPIFIYPWKQPCTYHTYMEGGIRILKSTFWYNMKSADQSLPEPQQEEGITKAEWTDAKELPVMMKRSYGSIADVLNI